jgi:hypothetical protein
VGEFEAIKGAEFLDRKSYSGRCISTGLRAEDAYG